MYDSEFMIFVIAVTKPAGKYKPTKMFTVGGMNRILIYSNKKIPLVTGFLI
jgi:hypothetical protein